MGVLEPLPTDQNTQVVFSDETVGTNIPKNYVAAIETGFRGVCEAGGSLCGAKVVGVRFRLQDGAHHSVDSSDWAFQQAAEGAMRQGKLDCWGDLSSVEGRVPRGVTECVPSLHTAVVWR